MTGTLLWYRGLVRKVEFLRPRFGIIQDLLYLGQGSSCVNKVRKYCIFVVVCSTS